ncbi:MAG: S6e family ribosomal protein [Candidatus Woesearchaeota archaeon]
MADLKVKLNIGDSKSKKTYNKELTQEQFLHFLNKKIGDVVKGDAVELAGYELTITGGSDAAGVPMRRDVHGPNRKRILAVGGTGIKSIPRDGAKIRKLVAGNTVYDKTSQINTIVSKWGKDPIEPVKEPAQDSKEDAAKPASEEKTSESK